MLSNSSREHSADLVRCPDVWYEDGTIILRANNVMFKVYKGILSAQSPVFKDMFGVSQPFDAPSYEGCLVVDVHDTPEDLTVFLKALHQWEYVAT
ncbi:hypothetical protein BDV98DRAFT_572768 [Pterulicium gracile]|uniref:BTB domain-containing protein n=1 Tax=Pterulicium gracile TaxID=1884261 RepID=A0A5C3QBC0_9AGAR|nr:hypothetical protein BDV98DRAFT_572768 [Pterula gracilis]